MLLRIILFILLVYVFTRIFKKLFSAPSPRAARAPNDQWFGTAGPKHVDEMVQDPVCKVYVPKREALTAQGEGATYYFCSRECLEKFKDRTPGFGPPYNVS